jgi:hypothetical protein
MSRDELVRAGEQLDHAAETAGGDASETLSDLAEQLRDLADRETAPDHGRLARIQNHATDVKEDLEGEPVAAIEDAHDHVNAFRETIEGV